MSAALVRGMALIALVHLFAGCPQNELGRVMAEEHGDLEHAPAPRAWFDAEVREACGEPEIAEEAFARQPYLQLTTSSSTKVMWRQASPPPAEVRVRAARAESRPPASIAYSHESREAVALLEGLAPASVYCYELDASGETLARGLGFRTAPAEEEAPVRFAAAGDVGYRSVDQAAVLGQLRTVPLEFLLLAGDIAYDHGSLEEFEENFFAPYQDLVRIVPVFAAPGNHDYETRDGEPFRQVFALPEPAGGAGIWYSTTWGNVHLAIIDTERFEAEHLAWLDRDLAGAHATWKVVVGHTPPYASGRYGGDRRIREDIVPILERRGVDLALFGHEHHYERTVPIRGVTYVITGGGGRGTRWVGSSEFTAFAEQVAHFVFLEATADELVGYAIDGVGQEFDTFALRAR
jgi:acid phosphatase type 7